MSAGAGVDTSVAVGAVRLPNPVIAASGTFGYGTEFAGLVDLGALGALAVKGLSLRPAAGKPAPRLVETPGGMLNAIGLQNIGVEAFLAGRLPALRAAGARVVANFWGDSPEEFAECAARLDGAPGVVALELNASSPNRPEWGSILATDPQTLAAIVRAVRARVRAPLWVKLSPNVGDITRVGRAAEAEGADALTAINTLRATAVDVATRRARLASGTGGLSGPAIKPVALRMVHELARAVRIPLVGVGGIMTGEDALEFLVCGASAVQVGTATFYDPRAPLRVAEEMAHWCRAHGVSAVSDMIGTLRT
ncbi:MAG: dihydroorotate dehydrogenase [Deltaproteobacteria bacterium]|nr:MAG: dihydroorotate dehydrogenase [Deltaproteobacteria bacterium]